MISHMDRKEELWFSHLHAYKGKTVLSGTCPGKGPVQSSVNLSVRKTAPGSPNPTRMRTIGGTGSDQAPSSFACCLRQWPVLETQGRADKRWCVPTCFPRPKQSVASETPELDM